MLSRTHKTRVLGFTFVELMVVVTIISILSSVAYMGYDDVRKQARDARRMSDLEAIAKVLALDMFERGQAPDCQFGVVIEPGMPMLHGNDDDCVDKDYIENLLLEYFPEIPGDPLGPGHEEYFYFYDRHQCDPQPRGLMVFANMEKPGNSNAAEVCGKLDAGGNQGWYKQNTNTGEEHFPFVVRIESVE